MTPEETSAATPIPNTPEDPTTTVFVEDDINFAELYEQSLSIFKEHQIVTGKVIDVGKDFATVDIGYKSEGQIPIEEFLDENRELQVAIGDDIEVITPSTSPSSS